MISAGIAFDALAARLTARASRLAVARATTRLLAARQDESRWRRAALVWPLFGKDT
jgi:hypothetical protein